MDHITAMNSAEMFKNWSFTIRTLNASQEFLLKRHDTNLYLQLQLPIAAFSIYLWNYSFIHSGDLHSASSRHYYSEVLPLLEFI